MKKIPKDGQTHKVFNSKKLQLRCQRWPYDIRRPPASEAPQDTISIGIARAILYLVVFPENMFSVIARSKSFHLFHLLLIKGIFCVTDA